MYYGLIAQSEQPNVIIHHPGLVSSSACSEYKGFN